MSGARVKIYRDPDVMVVTDRLGVIQCQLALACLTQEDAAALRRAANMVSQQDRLGANSGTRLA